MQISIMVATLTPTQPRTQWAPKAKWSSVTLTGTAERPDTELVLGVSQTTGRHRDALKSLGHVLGSEGSEGFESGRGRKRY